MERPGGGIFKSTDGGTTWKPAHERPARDGIVAGRTSRSRRAIRSRLYAIDRTPADRSASIAPTTPAKHWARVNDRPAPAGRIGGGDLAGARSIRRTPTSSTSPAPSPGSRPTAARPWTAFRGAPGGDDYQQHLDQPEQPEHHPARQRSGRDRHASTAARPGARWYNQPTAQMYHVNADNAFPYRVCGGQQESGSACVVEPRQRRPDHLPRLASGRRRRVRLRRARSARPEHRLRRQGHALRPPHRPGRRTSRPTPVRAGRLSHAAHRAGRVLAGRPARALLRREHAVEDADGGNSWKQISPDLTRKTWERAGEHRQVHATADSATADAARRDLHHRAVAARTSIASGPAPTTA